MDPINHGNAKERAFQEAHVSFIKMWTTGVHVLEIADRLNLTEAQIRNHKAEAAEENVSRVKPAYEAVRWAKLPKPMQKLTKTHWFELIQPVTVLWSH